MDSAATPLIATVEFTETDPALSPNTEGADGELKAQIPWLRVFVEGVVIVGSIL